MLCLKVLLGPSTCSSVSLKVCLGHLGLLLVGLKGMSYYSPRSTSCVPTASVIGPCSTLGTSCSQSSTPATSLLSCTKRGNGNKFPKQEAIRNATSPNFGNGETRLYIYILKIFKSYYIYMRNHKALMIHSNLLHLNIKIKFTSHLLMSHE